MPDERMPSSLASRMRGRVTRTCYRPAAERAKVAAAAAGLSSIARMHRSRLSTFVIDCKTNDLHAATQFWSKALGRASEGLPDGDTRYQVLAGTGGEPILLTQSVEHESRIHLDIEADDLEAEVRRLEALGARRIAWVKNWFVMEAPTGHRFCVVKPQRGPLDEKKRQSVALGRTPPSVRSQSLRRHDACNQCNQRWRRTWQS